MAQAARRVTVAKSVQENAPAVALPREIALAHPRGFFLEVYGESMNRIIPNGYLVLIDPDSTIRDGAIVAAHIAGQGQTLKRYHEADGVVVLEPESNDPSFRAIEVDAGLVSYLGEAVWWQPVEAQGGGV